MVGVQRILVTLCMVVFPIAIVDAAPPTRDVYGKSITVSWSESITGKLGYESESRNASRTYQLSLYISTAGRPFVRLTQHAAGFGFNLGKRSGPGRIGNVSQTAPDESSTSTKADHVKFEGRSVVVYRELESGARRIAIDLDGPNSCRANVVIGRQSGRAAVLRLRSGSFEISSIQTTAVSCSVSEGNVFGQ